jgi:hypothetical protein
VASCIGRAVDAAAARKRRAGVFRVMQKRSHRRRRLSGGRAKPENPAWDTLGDALHALRGLAGLPWVASLRTVCGSGMIGLWEAEQPDSHDRMRKMFEEKFESVILAKVAAERLTPKQEKWLRREVRKANEAFGERGVLRMLEIPFDKIKPTAPQGQAELAVQPQGKVRSYTTVPDQRKAAVDGRS